MRNGVTVIILFSISLLFQVDKNFSKKASPFFRAAALKKSAATCLHKNLNIKVVKKILNNQKLK